MTTKTNTDQTNKAAQNQGAAVPKDVMDLSTTSARIRALDAKGWTRAQIAKALGKRYQHVRNVLVTPIKSQG